MKYGTLEGNPIFIMEKATKKVKGKNLVCVQSLITGECIVIKKRLVKNITSKYPL